MVWKIVLVVCLTGYVQSEQGAVSEQRVVIHQLKSEKSDKPLQDGSKKTEYREEYAWSYPSYEFSYKVNDPETKDIKGQHEKRHGDEVKGLYWLIEPNGHKRTVNYQADDNTGFNAQVDYTAKEHSNEYKSNNEENNEVEEKAKEINESNAANEENSTNDKEQESINNQENVNETANVEEKKSDEQNNVQSEGNVDAAEGEVSNQNENKEEGQNNENNMMNVIESNKGDSENLGNENIKYVYEEQDENIEYNNRRRSRADINRNENSGKLSDSINVKNRRSRGNQNHNKFRYQENIEQNRKSGAYSKRSEGSQKHITRASRGNKNKGNSDIDLKNHDDEKKDQLDNYELHFVASNAKENLAHGNEEKSNRFEHRIRVHHPKPNVKN